MVENSVEYREERDKWSNHLFNKLWRINKLQIIEIIERTVSNRFFKSKKWIQEEIFPTRNISHNDRLVELIQEFKIKELNRIEIQLLS